MRISADEVERQKQLFIEEIQMMKRVLSAVGAVLMALGAALWLYVAMTQEDPLLRRAAYQVAPLPAVISYLLIQQVRRRLPGQK
ncbi:hypothetical protein KW807_00065 [Candidatus Parcubacteria bacterium]|nr:hypothetical protein [Candidatus Parcubacteria bacterium]